MPTKLLTPRRLSVKDKKQIISDSFDYFLRTMPEAKCELFFQSPYQLLVSVVLSAQATDKSVNKCMEQVYRSGFSPELAVKIGEKGILQLIRSIGLAPTKSKNVFRLSQLLLERHSGEVPNSRVALEALPGVGRKTANVILGELFQHPTMAVDTHVFRLGLRLGLHREKDAEKAETRLLELIDPKYLPIAHHWFILHGRYVCKARTPDCDSCGLQSFCPSVH